MEMEKMNGFKVGDYVLINNPDAFADLVKGKVARIIEIEEWPEYMYSKVHPFIVSFVKPIRFVNGMERYNAREFVKISKEEAWLYEI